jgi:hypothetical protein
LAQIDMAPMARFVDELSGQLGTFLPGLIGAIIILLVGWIVATVVAFGTKKILKTKPLLTIAWPTG